MTKESLPEWSLDVFAFLQGIRLLRSNDGVAKPDVKVRVTDAIRAGLELEPRVIEVLPAALIHYPESFTDKDKIPDKLANVIDSILAGKEEGLELAGIPYSAMKRWADVHEVWKLK